MPDSETSARVMPIANMEKLPIPFFMWMNLV
jgi:hypothetical protein